VERCQPIRQCAPGDHRLVRGRQIAEELEQDFVCGSRVVHLVEDNQDWICGRGQVVEERVHGPLGNRSDAQGGRRIRQARAEKRPAQPCDEKGRVAVSGLETQDGGCNSALVGVCGCEHRLSVAARGDQEGDACRRQARQ
jgi:hypothetical protein